MSMTAETYLERMAALGIGRGLLGQDMAFPPDFASLVTQALEADLLNPEASMRVERPPLVGEAPPPDRRYKGSNLVAAFLGGKRAMAGLRGNELDHAAVLAEAWRRAETPMEKLTCHLYARGTTLCEVTRQSGLSKCYVRAVLQTGGPRHAWQRVRELLTPEERAVLGHDDAVDAKETNNQQERSAV